MMQVVFLIEYHTRWGEQLYITGPDNALQAWDKANAIAMEYAGDGIWRGVLEIKRKRISGFAYKYFIVRDGQVHWEWGAYRKLNKIPGRAERLVVRDSWRPAGVESNVFYTNAFAANLMRRRKPAKSVKHDPDFNAEFTLEAPGIPRDRHLYIVGNCKTLGKWSLKNALRLDDSDYPKWKGRVKLPKKQPFVEYKYCIVDEEAGKIVQWEYGPNHNVDLSALRQKGTAIVQNDIFQRAAEMRWRGSGVAVPVFSLRSRTSYGVGEFRDLRLLIDWVAACGMKMVQILPINDTVASHTWHDSYPYAAISVFALHPIYLHPPDMGKIRNAESMERYRKEAGMLNSMAAVDYEKVMQLKSAYFKELYDQERDTFLVDPDFLQFFRENEGWLVPYAAFSRFRDQYKTPDFSKWKAHTRYDDVEVRSLIQPDRKNYDHFAVHFFIQYHLHKQMMKVADYARKKGVVLKGDIPIGIYRHSVDAWVAPHLYNMDRQAGAPPDDFSVTGQNWGFPTYNWDEMARDGYSWWKARLQKMASYFDAYRIDHILGFFRIWEIPLDQVEGLLGKFNPALPMHKYEMEGNGMHLDEQRFCDPYIDDHILDQVFGDLKEEAIERYLVRKPDGRYRLRAAVECQAKVEAALRAKPDDGQEVIEKKKRLKNGLFTLIGNVLLLKEDAEDAYHPRVAFQHTLSFSALQPDTKQALNRIYNHYFYDRHEKYWREQAMIKLPEITSATNMLVCGEDLGMVPAVVPGVMRELGILSLEIQRMPKHPAHRFSNPAHAPYLSVCSTSSHDMSTLRGWWHEDSDTTKAFYNDHLGEHGDPPPECTPNVVEKIIAQHLESPAMWAVFPVQDLLSMDEKLRNHDMHAERINVPSNPKNYWKYRLHITLEDLIAADGFTDKLRVMIGASGRAI
jgi:4-alpha-glucanotransferase